MKWLLHNWLLERLLLFTLYAFKAPKNKYSCDEWKANMEKIIN